ncbi:hypothetical protein MTR62_02445 [Novosphingobium sp. 1949]|uniref:PilZ domain-containing protein n=1 Tax=Novosphingobium organovorum TaxID=2930092 RepID=A0ABT0B972_9SPHN|nr:hypothetical protein [Novosphingobium organovorum]MCJ2181573.1 hypothetical protein [Novosphingobium organovorum]
MMFHKQRLEARTVLAVQGTMRFGGISHEVTLGNASSRGVLALIDTPPPRGTPVQVQIGDVVLDGQVRWRGPGRCGISLSEPIDVNRLLSGRIVPLAFVPAHQFDSYRGPQGIFRTIVNEGPLANRAFNAVLLVAAVASAAFALARLGTSLDTALSISTHDLQSSFTQAP